MDGWRELVVAIVRHAGEEASRGDLDAIFWLQDPVILDSYVSVAGIDSRKVIGLAADAEQKVIRRRARELLARERQRRRQLAGARMTCNTE